VYAFPLESVFPESEISSPSDWVASDTGTAGHGRPGDRETRIPTPALSRRPPLPQPPALPLQASTPSIFAETPAHLPCIPPASSDTIQSTPEPPQPETHANRTVTPLSETHEGRTISPKSDTASSPGASPKPSRGAGGRPTTKALGLIESAFEQIALIIEGLVESTGKPASDLYRRFERSRKGPSTSQFWNVYTHYFANNEKEESKRVPGPPARTQDFRSRCYTQYKLAHPNYRELLETYRELEMASVEMTVGQRKKEIEKYEKKLRDLVSLSI
jgi:hypothetical protein